MVPVWLPALRLSSLKRDMSFCRCNPARPALPLLIYLVVEGGRHSREALAALLWPESDARRGRAALRNTLAQLKACLHHSDPATTRGRDDGHLIVEHNFIAFGFGSDFALDISTLHTGFLAVQRSDTPHSRLMAQLKEATALCRGGFLLSSPVNSFNYLAALAKTSSAVFVHTKGMAPWFHRFRKALMAPTRAATLSKLPLRMA